jgi:hypothetical protein
MGCHHKTSPRLVQHQYQRNLPLLEFNITFCEERLRRILQTNYSWPVVVYNSAAFQHISIHTHFWEGG